MLLVGLEQKQGIHRLVRKSPFDSNDRRHIIQCSICLSWKLMMILIIEINPADLRIDVYRASGARWSARKQKLKVRSADYPYAKLALWLQCQND